MFASICSNFLNPSFICTTVSFFIFPYCSVTSTILFESCSVTIAAIICASIIMPSSSSFIVTQSPLSKSFLYSRFLTVTVDSYACETLFSFAFSFALFFIFVSYCSCVNLFPSASSLCKSLASIHNSERFQPICSPIAFS